MKKKIIIIISSLVLLGIVALVIFIPKEKNTSGGSIDTFETCVNGHTMITIPASEPTCVTNGSNEYLKCKYCNYTEGKEVIPALGHDEEVVESAISPTCFTTGRTAKIKCVRCEKILQDSTIVGKTSHNFVVVEGVEATCLTKGLSEGRKCSVCGYVDVQQTVIPAKDHVADVQQKVEPTCTEAGIYNQVLCVVCGKVLKEQEILYPLGHDEFVTAEGSEPTCTDTGLKDIIECRRCGEIVQQAETIPALGHDLEVIVGYSATCTTTGLTHGVKCKRCNYVEEQEVIPALGHSFTTIAGKAATCTATGYSSYKQCTRCDYYTGKNIIAMKAHTYGSNLYHDDQYHYKMCIYCASVGTKTQHIFATWTTKKIASNGFHGEESRDCEHCAYSEVTRPIPADPVNGKIKDIAGYIWISEQVNTSYNYDSNIVYDVTFKAGNWASVDEYSKMGLLVLDGRLSIWHGKSEMSTSRRISRRVIYFVGGTDTTNTTLIDLLEYYGTFVKGNIDNLTNCMVQEYSSYNEIREFDYKVDIECFRGYRTYYSGIKCVYEDNKFVLYFYNEASSVKVNDNLGKLYIKGGKDVNNPGLLLWLDEAEIYPEGYYD